MLLFALVISQLYTLGAPEVISYFWTKAGQQSNLGENELTTLFVSSCSDSLDQCGVIEHEKQQNNRVLSIRSVNPATRIARLTSNLSFVSGQNNIGGRYLLVNACCIGQSNLQIQ